MDNKKPCEEIDHRGKMQGRTEHQAVKYSAFALVSCSLVNGAVHAKVTLQTAGSMESDGFVHTKRNAKSQQRAMCEVASIRTSRLVML